MRVKFKNIIILKLYYTYIKGPGLPGLWLLPLRQQEAARLPARLPTRQLAGEKSGAGDGRRDQVWYSPWGLLRGLLVPRPPWRSHHKPTLFKRVSSCCCCCSECAVISILLQTFLLSDSGCTAAVDIYDVPIVPAAAVISDVNRVPAVVGLPACCYFTTFARIPAFAGVPTMLAIMLLLSFLLLLACLLLRAVLLLLFSLLMFVAGVTAVLASLLLLAFLLLLVFLKFRMFSLLLVSLLLWRPMCGWRSCCCFRLCCCWRSCVASIPADPFLPSLAGVFTYCSVQWDTLGYQTIEQWQSDCYFLLLDFRSIEYQTGEF